jgi:transposase-like protein
MNERNHFNGVNSIKFYNTFSTDEDCYHYLADIKWSEKSFICRKCGHRKYYKGLKPFSRRCMKCKYDESPTAGTMFDKCKFPLLLAFHIAFKISTKKKGMSSLELSQEFELRQKTCWEFKWKIQQAMQSSKLHPISGIVHVDEFYIGGEEVGKRGRSKSDKKLVVIALEIVEGGVGRAYAQCIDNASSVSFRPFFETYISKDTKVITDEWKGYIPLKKTYPNLEQLKSENGKSFQDIHIHIMNLKGWLRGIHHHCSRDRLQGYLDEYHFRYNRRSNMDTIFDSLINKMVFSNPIRLQSVN